MSPHNCSTQPEYITFDPDITGTGVLIGYTATAGLVTIIIVLHYFLAYNPTLNPFRPDNQSPSQSVFFRPNPVDEMILKAVRPIPKNLARLCGFKSWYWARLDLSVTKFVLSMSDIQVITGIAILISGYAQLSQGISCYHWLVIGRLAWFSSLTHLSCLTLLRDYLRDRPAQRQWRLISMAILTIMLLVALVPTGNYQWAVTGRSDWCPTYKDCPLFPEPSYQATCYFSKPLQAGSAATLSMWIFLLLSSLGFLIRVVKLNESLSFHFVGRPRKFFSMKVRTLLRKLHQKQQAESLRWRIAGRICYYPSLAFFLAIRVVLDHWASMYFEVFWLFVSFLYGLFSLFIVTDVFPTGLIESIEQTGYSNRWTVGQIMPVALLAIPFINVIELFYRGDDTKNTSIGEDISLQSTVLLPQQDMSRTLAHEWVLEASRQRDSPTFDPDQDYYQLSTSLKGCNILIILLEPCLSAFVLTLMSGRESLARMFSEDLIWWLYIPVFSAVAFGVFWAQILISFLIDWTVTRNYRGSN